MTLESFSLTGRVFRTSRIVPYAANLLFILYDCQRGPRLQLLVNETPVRFPGLEAEDAPLYRDVRATYRHLLDGCDFQRECEGRTVGRGPNTELWAQTDPPSPESLPSPTYWYTISWAGVECPGENVCVINERGGGGDWERRRNDQSCLHSLIAVPLIVLISDWVCFSSCAL